jgi:hypothetical protein
MPLSEPTDPRRAGRSDGGKEKIPFKEGNLEEPGPAWEAILFWLVGYDMVREVDGVCEMRYRLKDCARGNAGSER